MDQMVLELYLNQVGPLPAIGGTLAILGLIAFVAYKNPEPKTNLMWAAAVALVVLVLSGGSWEVARATCSNWYQSDSFAERQKYWTQNCRLIVTCTGEGAFARCSD